MGSNAGLLAKVVLASVGLIAALLAANVLRRHQLYYRNYVARAKEIEGQLKVGGKQIVNLYSGAEAVKSASCTLSSKNAFIAFFMLSALLFLLSVVVFAWQYFSACAP